MPPAYPFPDKHREIDQVEEKAGRPEAPSPNTL
jgi:hypothetical protein